MSPPHPADLGRGGKRSAPVPSSDVHGRLGQASPRAVKKTPSAQLALLGRDPHLSLLKDRGGEIQCVLVTHRLCRLFEANLRGV